MAFELCLLFLVSVIGNPINQTFYELKTPIYNTYWCEIQSDQREQQVDWLQILFALTEDGRLYKSADKGRTWTDESVVFEKMGVSDVSRFHPPEQFYELYISPANKEIFYMVGGNGYAIRSEDCGSRYNSFQYPRELYDFKFNSIDDDWILAFSDCKGCVSPFDKHLHMSIDMGKTWQLVLSNVSSALWDKLIDSDMIPDLRIISNHLAEGKPIISYSDDQYKTYKEIANNSIGFFQSEYHMFVTTQKDNNQELLVSPAFYDYIELKPISVPFKEKYSFNILNSDNDVIFLAITHNSTNKKLANLFSSDYQAFKFTLSLQNIFKNLDTGLCDFQLVKSIKGVYIANIYDHQQLGQPNFEKFKKTMITYDKGAIWHPVKAPQRDANNRSIACKENCSLHFQSPSISEILSESNALGIIIASGNVGLYLEEKEINTYLSRDGGHTWYEIRKGHNVYGIADRGGLILIAKANTLVEEIIYSWDEGLTWTSIALKRRIFVEKFIAISLYLQITVIAKDENQKGVILTLDFAQLHQRVCSKMWAPTDPESDYEYWTPQIYESGQCYFGQKFRYIRRKREAQCFNQQDHDKLQYVDTCECTEDDWECDYGFYRKLERGPCVPITSQVEEDSVPDLQDAPLDCQGTYMKRTGYRKVVGDFCHGGVDHSPIPVPCPNYVPKATEADETDPQADSNSAMQFKVTEKANQTNLKSASSLSWHAQLEKPQGPYVEQVKIILLVLFIALGLLVVIKLRNGQNSQAQQVCRYRKKEQDQIRLMEDHEEL